MRLSRWLILIGIMVGLGCLQVAQHNALLLKGYVVGGQIRDVHRQEADLSWLNGQVVNLSSPAHLARVAQARRLNFVAWSTLSPAPVRAGTTATPVALARSEADDDHAD